MLVVSGEEDFAGVLSGWWVWFECFGWPMWILGVFQMCCACSVRMAVFDGLHVNGSSWLRHPSVIR